MGHQRILHKIFGWGAGHYALAAVARDMVAIAVDHGVFPFSDFYQFASDGFCFGELTLDYRLHFAVTERDYFAHCEANILHQAIFVRAFSGGNSGLGHKTLKKKPEA